jgi:citrate synthase
MKFAARVLQNRNILTKPLTRNFSSKIISEEITDSFGLKYKMENLKDPIVSRGLRGVLIESDVSYANGKTGELSYSGYGIRGLANAVKQGKIDTLDISYLINKRELPTKEQRSVYEKEIIDHEPLPKYVQDSIFAAPRSAYTMNILSSSVLQLSHVYPDRLDSLSPLIRKEAKIGLMVHFPEIIANIIRHKTSQKPLPSRIKELGYDGNFIWMISGQEPTERQMEASILLNLLHKSHGASNCVFTSMSTASTGASFYACLSSAMNSLGGPRHGKGNEDAIENLENLLLIVKQRKTLNQTIKYEDVINEVVEEYITHAFKNKISIPGIGHAIYKVDEQRASVISELLEEADLQGNDRLLFEIAKVIERKTKEKKNLPKNIDLVSGLYGKVFLGFSKGMHILNFAYGIFDGLFPYIELQIDRGLIRSGDLYTGYAPRELPLTYQEKIKGGKFKVEQRNVGKNDGVGC